MRSDSYSLSALRVGCVGLALFTLAGCNSAAALKKLETSIAEKVQGIGEKVEGIEASFDKKVAGLEDRIHQKVEAKLEEKLNGLASDIEKKLASKEAELDGNVTNLIDYVTAGENIVDEAMADGLTREDFPQSEHDAFKGMDKWPEEYGEYEYSKEEIMGRNTWIAWAAGTQRMWDFLGSNSYGLVDLLKTIDSRNRANRFKEMGCINEPGMTTSAEPTNPYGIYLDVPKDPEKKKALWDEQFALYRTEGLDPQVYGYSSGILGFRLFPNPEFFEKPEAQKAWDAKKFYEDRVYFESPKLVRPYRVGMTCGICHVAFNPIYPPDDVAEPNWENLSSAIGNQYFREGLTMGRNVTLQDTHEQNFYWQALNIQPPGTSDTSRIASDHINGPTAINAIFRLKERLRVAVPETMGAGASTMPGDGDAPDQLTGGQRNVPHILRDGADSIGAPGATIRVYLNIGMFSEYWLTRHQPGVGLVSQKPFEIAVAKRNSVYWQATEDRLGNEKKFLSGKWPMQLKYAKLKDGTTGQEYLDKQPGDLQRGKVLFGENCARCHSSKRPPAEIDQNGKDTPELKAWFAEAVKDDAFWEDNFLSEDRRHAVNEKGLETNASRALGSNAAAGHIWDNFSSTSYKQLPAVGEITGGFPDEPITITAPGGGRGYYRTPSLVAIWTTAPYLSSNTVGKFTGDPSVEGRLEAFHDGIEKMLGLKPRDNVVWTTKGETYLEIPGGVFPPEIRRLVGDIIEPLKGREAHIRLGPIPAGTPINLLLNLNLTIENRKQIIPLLIKMKKELVLTQTLKMSPAEAAEHMKKHLREDLLKNNLCPDFVMDKGHTFGNELPEEDKRSLIKFVLSL